MPRSDLVIDNLCVAYGDAVPLRELSLTVREGEFLSLLGPSGCGKTTTLRAVAGFVDPAGGDIRIGDQSILSVPPNRRNIGMVYQDYALFPHLTVRENIAFGMKMRRVPTAEIRTRVERAIDQLQLTGMGGRYPKQLSGGQQQRVALARAMVINPSVLLLDEPLAALDKQLRADMQFELRRLQRAVGITTMFVTHDQEEALSLSDRIAVMNKGEILQVDTPQIVYDRPTHRFVAEFIGVGNFLPGRIVGSEGEGALVALDDVPGTHRVAGAHAPGAVEIMLRPEKLTLQSGAAAASVNSCAGRIGNSVFVGTLTKYQIELHSGRKIRVDAPAGPAGPIAINEPVALSWRAEDARVYRDGKLE
ncbi:MAG: ABC transporter ATP-binding protein [Variibacter sp.]|nr:ABC transporter ATP-binding protein [Variibacter sp.]